jgi:adenosylmethionine-8-amino-7-oxononanoate aminotransferase
MAAALGLRASARLPRRLKSTAAAALEPWVGADVEALQEKQGKYVWHPMTQQRPWSVAEAAPPVPVAKAAGSTLTRMDGTELLDAMGGLWCVNIGYGREEVARAAYEAMTALPFLSPLHGSAPQIELAAKISELLRYDAHVYFTASGSEANEAAFKIARQYHAANVERDPSGPLRHKIIARHRAYHGNTAGAMAATGQAERKIGFGPQPPGYLHVPPPYAYRRPAGVTVEQHGAEVCRQLEETIVMEGEQTVAAFVMEPVMSGGGVLVPHETYLRDVRRICDKYGVLLILDEVVSGFGRTGAMFGHQHYGATPDIITLAKGLTSGYCPLGACAVTSDVFDRFHDDPFGASGKSTLPSRLAHFRSMNTYGGHPVACAVGLKNIEIIEREGLVDRARDVGDFLRGSLEAALDGHPLVGEVRGMGLLIGVELVTDVYTRQPIEEDRSAAVVNACAEMGVIVGRNGSTVPGLCNVLILAPPFIVTEDECHKITDAIKRALDAAV